MPSHLAGESLVALMKDAETEWKTTAVSRYRNGDTIRSDTHRYSEYKNKQGQQTSEMLYDHENDPGENKNIAKSNPALVKELLKQLNASSSANRQ
ncbi:MAG: hypothetical protein R3C11_13060 [Planctomycetaceae bacterium]